LAKPCPGILAFPPAPQSHKCATGPEGAATGEEHFWDAAVRPSRHRPTSPLNALPEPFPPAFHRFAPTENRCRETPQGLSERIPESFWRPKHTARGPPAASWRARQRGCRQPHSAAGVASGHGGAFWAENARRSPLQAVKRVRGCPLYLRKEAICRAGGVFDVQTAPRHSCVYAPHQGATPRRLRTWPGELEEKGHAEDAGPCMALVLSVTSRRQSSWASPALESNSPSHSKRDAGICPSSRCDAWPDDSHVDPVVNGRRRGAPSP
jgi:hypothetical protein